MDKDVDHGVDGAFAAGADELESEVLVEDAVVENGAQKRAGGEGGVDLAEGPGGGLAPNEVGDDAVDDLALALEDVLGELMFFEGAEEDQAEEVGVFGVVLDDERGEPGEEGSRVGGLGQLFELGAAFVEALLGGIVDDGGVELAFGLEVLVKNRLGDADAFGEFAGGAAPEADFSKQLGGGVDNGLSPVGTA